MNEILLFWATKGATWNEQLSEGLILNLDLTFIVDSYWYMIDTGTEWLEGVLKCFVDSYLGDAIYGLSSLSCQGLIR